MGTKRTRATSPRYAVVVGLDFSPPSEAALREAIELAGRRPGGEVHVVYALDAEPGAAAGRGSKKLDVRIEKATAKLRAYMTKARAKFRSPSNLCVLAMHVRVRAAAPAIVQAAIDLDADLVVIGTRHAKGVKGLLIGSTGSKVMKNARCPVLLVKPKNYAGLRRSPSVEPQCHDCVARRLETKGATWWCRRHADRSALPLHIYSFSLSHPMSARNVDLEGPGA